MASDLDSAAALSTLLQLIEDYHAFNPGPVPVYPYPTSLDFSKQVSRGRPCVYRLDRKVKGGDEERAILDAPAFRWTKESLGALVEGDVEVAVTPDGRADSLYPLPRRNDSRDEEVEEGDGGDEAYDGRREDNVDERDGEDEGEDEEQVFVQPATINMSLSRLLDTLTHSSSSSTPSSERVVYYLQSQNSNLTTSPLSALRADLPLLPSFATPVLGDAPEAQNIWIGSDRSVTSTHRDPYENLYLVLKGRKRFTLYAPVEEVCLHATRVRTGRWDLRRHRRGDGDEHVSGRGNGGGEEARGTEEDLDCDWDWKIRLDNEQEDGQGTSSSTSASTASTLTSSSIAAGDCTATDSDKTGSGTGPFLVPWIPIDPYKPPPTTSSRYPYYQYAHPLTVTVSEGEILYLPAGWFHHVSQECGEWDDGSVAPCIAVNYWFDMDYEGEKYVMREMLGGLVERVRNGNG